MGLKRVIAQDIQKHEAAAGSGATRRGKPAEAFAAGVSSHARRASVRAAIHPSRQLHRGHSL